MAGCVHEPEIHLAGGLVPPEEIGGAVAVEVGRTVEMEVGQVGGGGSDSAAYGNVAFGNYTAILGGIYNIAGDPDLASHTIGERATISGGDTNKASGTSSHVSGGKFNKATGGVAVISGGYTNKASGYASFVGGGGKAELGEGFYPNEAYADYSAILGGFHNTAGDPAKSDHAVGLNATISGGRNNKVSGDDYNTASGIRSSVSGGRNRTAAYYYEWVAGALTEPN